MHFIKLLNYSETVRNQSPVQVRWQNVGSPGAKLYHRGCCYWVWQVLIRITSSCCFQTEGKKSFYLRLEWKLWGARRISSFICFLLQSSWMVMTHSNESYTSTKPLATDAFMPLPSDAETSAAELILISTRTPPWFLCCSFMPSLPLSLSHHERKVMYGNLSTQWWRVTKVLLLYLSTI